MPMTIDLEGIRSIVCRIVSQELRADVTGSVHSHKRKAGRLEVTFDLWVELLGTRINRHLFVVIRPQYWNCGDFEKMVRNYANSVIAKDLFKSLHADLVKKAEMN